MFTYHLLHYVRMLNPKSFQKRVQNFLLNIVFLILTSHEYINDKYWAFHIIRSQQGVLFMLGFHEQRNAQLQTYNITNYITLFKDFILSAFRAGICYKKTGTERTAYFPRICIYRSVTCSDQQYLKRTADYSSGENVNKTTDATNISWLAQILSGTVNRSRSIHAIKYSYSKRFCKSSVNRHNMTEKV